MKQLVELASYLMSDKSPEHIPVLECLDIALGNVDEVLLAAAETISSTILVIYKNIRIFTRQ